MTSQHSDRHVVARLPMDGRCLFHAIALAKASPENRAVWLTICRNSTHQPLVQLGGAFDRVRHDLELHGARVAANPYVQFLRASSRSEEAESVLAGRICQGATAELDRNVLREIASACDVSCSVFHCGFDPSSCQFEASQLPREDICLHGSTRVELLLWTHGDESGNRREHYDLLVNAAELTKGTKRKADQLIIARDSCQKSMRVGTLPAIFASQRPAKTCLASINESDKGIPECPPDVEKWLAAHLEDAEAEKLWEIMPRVFCTNAALTQKEARHFASLLKINRREHGRELTTADLCSKLPAAFLTAVAVLRCNSPSKRSSDITEHTTSKTSKRSREAYESSDAGAVEPGLVESNADIQNALSWLRANPDQPGCSVLLKLAKSFENVESVLPQHELRELARQFHVKRRSDGCESTAQEMHSQIKAALIASVHVMKSVQQDRAQTSEIETALAWLSGRCGCEEASKLLTLKKHSFNCEEPQSLKETKKIAAALGFELPPRGSIHVLAIRLQFPKAFLAAAQRLKTQGNASTTGQRSLLEFTGPVRETERKKLLANASDAGATTLCIESIEGAWQWLRSSTRTGDSLALLKDVASLRRNKLSRRLLIQLAARHSVTLMPQQRASKRIHQVDLDLLRYEVTLQVLSKARACANVENTYPCGLQAMATTHAQLAARCRDSSQATWCPYGNILETHSLLPPIPMQLIRHIALLELTQHSFGGQKQPALTYVGLLREIAADRRSRSSSSAPVDGDALRKHLNTRLSPTLTHFLLKIKGKTKPSQPVELADDVAMVFGKFANQHCLHEHLSSFDLGSCSVLAVFSFILQNKRTAGTSWLCPTVCYLPADKISDSGPLPMMNMPAQPHIPVEAAGRAVVTALVSCQLCGIGFSSRNSLRNHCENVHGNFAEYRKRLFWKAQQEAFLPLLPWVKRSMLTNFAFFQTHSVPGSGINDWTSHAASNAVPRREEACVICAVRNFVEKRFRVYLWKTIDSNCRETEDEVAAQEQDSESEDPHHVHDNSKNNRLLQDADGCFYLGPAELVHEHLDVYAYSKRMPWIPMEELQASSIQHPDHPNFRWLLHTRRVPTSEPLSADSTSEPVADCHPFPCAGVGIAASTVWCCSDCRNALCRKKSIRMPPLALANLMWLGREHPLYQNLSLATRLLLGVGRVGWRKVFLRKGAQDESQVGLCGNTVLLAQPSTSQITAALPPSNSAWLENIAVLFSNSRAQVTSSTALFVERQHYLKCAQIRQRICPVFSNIPIDEKRLTVDIPDAIGVPQALVEHAVHLEEVDNFAAQMDGPAAHRDPSAPVPTDAGEENECSDAEHTAGSPRQSEPLAPGDQATPSVFGECLIGLDEAHDEDPTRLFAVFQTKLRLLEEEAQKIARDQLRQQRTEERDPAALKVHEVARQEVCKHIALDLRDISRKLDTKTKHRLENAANATERVLPSNASALVVTSGSALSMFDARSWSACFVDFFYGDCVPNLDRPHPLLFEEIFRALIHREELEYSVASDASELAGGKYFARSTSRFDTPEFMAVFADTLRRLATLKGVRTAMRRPGFEKDLRLIANASADDFAHAHAVNGKAEGFASAARSNKVRPQVQTALKQLLLSTANVPLTEGYKVKLRHVGHAMNLFWGPLTLFMTANFADTYCPLVLSLFDASQTDPASRWTTQRVYLLEDEPAMPTLQVMHKLTASSPRTQATFFLLMEELVYRFLLGIDTVAIGRHFTRPALWCDREDDYASSGDPGLAGFALSALEPLESQGRGFSHGHKKIIGVPSMSAAFLKRVLAGTDIEAQAVMRDFREKLLNAAATIQYDSATLPAEQLGQLVLPETFTRKQQHQSRLDGGIEIDGSSREHLDITDAAEPGHISRERNIASSEDRPSRGAFKFVPLTGCQQSCLPTYRLPQAFARKTLLDNHGMCCPNRTTSVPARTSPPPPLPFPPHSSPSLSPSSSFVSPRTFLPPPSSVPPLPVATQSIPKPPALQSLTVVGPAGRSDETNDSAEQMSSDAPLTSEWLPFEHNDAGEVVALRLPGNVKATSDDILSDAARWETCFARDARALLCLNHDHDCTATCVKYAKKTAEASINGTSCAVPPCRFWFFRTLVFRVMQGAKELTKRIRRRGKALVTRAFIACTNDRHEYGRVIPQRGHPFRSSSNDVAQTAARCNVDVQYMPRALPEVEWSDSPAESTDQEKDSAASVSPSRFYGNYKLSPFRQHIVSVFQCMMFAAQNCDFYATKYLSKMQQSLSSAMGSIEAGVRRLHEELADQEQILSITDRAKRVVTRMAFAANKSTWFSACELALVITTGEHHFHTHREHTVFLSRPSFLMRECKRLLQGQASQGSVLEACVHEGISLVAFELSAGDAEELVSHNEPKEINRCDGAAKPVGEDAADEINSNQSDSSSNSGLSSEEVLSAKSQEGEQPQTLTHDEAQPSPEPPGAANLRVTTSTHDDWLHRGDRLSTLPFLPYVAYVERIRKPMPSDETHTPMTFSFDYHYPLSKLYCQALRHTMKIPRLHGYHCPRPDAGDKEDNPMCKSLLFFPLRCPGPEACADPLICKATLWPNGSGTFSFRAAWKARRAEIEVEADKGQHKTDRAKRIAVIKDTTCYKYWFRNPSDAVRGALLRCTVKQLTHAFAKRHWEHVCLPTESIENQILELLGVPTGRHPHQLHLSEFAALLARDVITNMDMTAEAASASKHCGTTIQAADQEVMDDISSDDETTKRPVAELGVVSGASDVASDDPASEDEALPDFAASAEHLGFDRNSLAHMLMRVDEIAAAKKPGRHKDAHIEMLNFSKHFGPLMTNVFAPFDVLPKTNLCFEAHRMSVLAHQKAVAKLLRADTIAEQVSTKQSPQAPSGLKQNQEAECFLVPLEDIAKGPGKVARKLCTNATLNEEQTNFIALVAAAMQVAWDRRSDPSSLLLDKDVPLIRVLLVGGGGCGKTKIINEVLTPLLQAFFGPAGCLKEAPSNKAARLLGGRTIHAANGLCPSDSLRTVHLKLRGDARKKMEKLMIPLGAKVIDEFSQLQAKLFHADALRTTYARAAPYNLMVGDYSSPSQIFGRMPVVILSGDELQLPPIPPTTSLLASLEGTSSEHKAGVSIFSNIPFVFRLKEMMRFTDPILKCILSKMRVPGGAALTQSEWQAVADTTVSASEPDGPLAACLLGTEDWYQAAYTWSVVSMAQHLRTVLSARCAKQCLYYVQAADAVANMPSGILPAQRKILLKRLLQEPNMNATGRLMGFCGFHIGMRVRITQTIEAPHVVIDSVGEVVGVEFDASERNHLRAQAENQCVILLQNMPVVYVKVDDCGIDFLPPKVCDAHVLVGPSASCSSCRFFTGVVAVSPHTCRRPFRIEVETDGVGKTTLQVVRTQIPLTHEKACTLYTLQGTTTSPGMIFHWIFPRRLAKDLKWLSMYVALSRVRSLSNLRSIGLTSELKQIIEGGPPGGLALAFSRMFAEKEAATQIAAAKAKVQLGWTCLAPVPASASSSSSSSSSSLLSSSSSLSSS
jgi:hypothetical protein